MFISHCCFQPLTQPYDPWLLLCDSLLKNRAANIPFWKWCKVKSWGLYRNRLQRPENGAGEAMQPLKIGFSKKKSTILPTKYSAFWWRIPGSNRWPLACHASALPAELIPQMFVPCLTTGVIIPALCRIVNRFRKIFFINFKKQNPRTEQSPILCRNVFFVMPVPAGFYFQTLVHLLSSSKNIVPLSHLFYKPTLL